MYGNNSWKSNNSRFGIGGDNNRNSQSSIGLGNTSGSMNGSTNSSPVIGSQSPEAKAWLGMNSPTISTEPAGVDRSGMNADFQKRHFGKLAAADAAYAKSADNINQTGLDQQALNHEIQLGTATQDPNAQKLNTENEKESTVYDPMDYNTWFDDM